MSVKKHKKRHTLLMILVILLAVPVTAALILTTHTQIIVGTIQKLSAGTVNTINSYEPLADPMESMDLIPGRTPYFSVTRISAFRLTSISSSF